MNYDSRPGINRQLEDERRAHRVCIEMRNEAESQIERLRKALKFYADATPADFANDNGHNALAALADEQKERFDG